MISTGVTGSEWRASVTPWGAVQPWDDVTAALDWYVAAEDRWHIPVDEPAVRQQRLEGTPVVETRVRVPNGDVVQRVYSVADHGGLTIVEVENESTAPVAVAFSHRTVLTERPIADVPIEGIDLPPEAFVVPLAHSASIRVALAHEPTEPGPLPAGLPTPLQVVRGWTVLTERASRFVLPDGELGSLLVERVTAQRCEIALGTLPTADEDPAGFALALGELVRMGESPDAWLPELVEAVESIAPREGWENDQALDAARRILAVADERRAGRDLDRIIDRRERAELPSVAPDGPRAIAWLESRLAVGPDLLPAGLPADWLGQSVDVYGVPTGATSSVSFALRWHGPRPAVLWEQAGEPVELTASTMAPEWRASDAKGETLWPQPPGATPVVEDGVKDDVDAGPSSTGLANPVTKLPPDEPGSFS